MTPRELPEVSVVIPCQGESVVDETVRSLLATGEGESADDVEVLVITPVPLPVAGLPEARVVILDRPVGPAAARNRGLSLARGQTIVFLDADCAPRPGWLAGIRRSQQLSNVVASGAVVSPTDSFVQLCYNLVGFREFLSSRPAGPRRFLPSFCLWGPRRAFAEAGGFDESLQTAEDLELTARLAAAGWQLRFDPSVRVLHRPQIQNVSAFMRRGWRHGQNSIRVRRKHRVTFGQQDWMFQPALLALGAPFVALYLWIRTVLGESLPLAVAARVAPVAIAYRVFWCLGAAWALRREGND